jgi:hypothetical protein
MKRLLPRIRRLLAAPSALTWHLFPAAWAIAASVAFYLAALLVTPGIAVRILAAQEGSPNSSSLTSLPASAPLTAEEQQKETEARFPYIIPCEFHPAEEDFADGDSISITSVRGDRKHIEPGGAYLVEGTYQLNSAAKAGLALSLASNTPTPTPASAGQRIRVARGTGNFALEANMSAEGDFHVSFYIPHGPDRDGRSRRWVDSGGGVYFREVLSLAEEEAEFPYEVPCRFEISTDDALSSDRIGITAVRENRKQILVEGTYQLKSVAKATLALILTTPNDTPALSGQHIRVTRGTGHFALRANLSGVGNYRVSFYDPSVGYTVHIIER